MCEAVSPSGATSSQIANCLTIHSTRRCACRRFAPLRFSIAVGKAAATAHSFHARLIAASSSFCNRFAAPRALAMLDAKGITAGGGAGFGCPTLRGSESASRRDWLNNARIRRGWGQAGNAWRGNFRRAWPQGRRCSVAGGWHHGEARRRLRIDAKARQVSQLDVAQNGRAVRPIVAPFGFAVRPLLALRPALGG